jgi:peptidoglycan endopeptidase LytE
VKLLLLVIGGFASAIVVLLLMVLSVIAEMPWLAVGVPGGPPSNAEVVIPRPAVEPVVVPVAAPVPTLMSAAAVPSDDLLERAIAATMDWLRVPYLWGGCTHRGVDCSCFVMNVLATVGIHAPRTTVPQLAWTTPVSPSDARIGDLVFFDNTCSGCGPNPTHVGIYLGAGKMVDCGDPCRVEAVYSGHNTRYGRVPGL